MRRIIAVAGAMALAIPLTAASATVASASGREPAAAQHRTIVVWPGQSIQAAVNRARPGDTVFVERGVYHQMVVIRKNRISLLGAGDTHRGTVLEPPSRRRHNICSGAFGPTGVCILARKVNLKNGKVRRQVRHVRVKGFYITRFRGSGVFGYGVNGLDVTHVAAIRDGEYGISRFDSTNTLFVHDRAVGNKEAGFYVGDSPHANALVRFDRAVGNQIGIFIRHARDVAVIKNSVSKNCQGVLVLDDSQRGGAGNAFIWKNHVFRNNKFCRKSEDTPVSLQGGGILLLGATDTVVRTNLVTGNRGRSLNSGGIVVASARPVTHGRNPKNIRIGRNLAFGNRPADLIWDGTGTGISFVDNHCGRSLPPGLCH